LIGGEAPDGILVCSDLNGVFVADVDELVVPLLIAEFLSSVKEHLQGNSILTDPFVKEGFTDTNGLIVRTGHYHKVLHEGSYDSDYALILSLPWNQGLSKKFLWK